MIDAIHFQHPEKFIMTDKSIELDQAAQQLFEEFGGIADRCKATLSTAIDGLTESLIAEQKRQDTWRILLIEMSHWLASYFHDPGFPAKVEAEQACFKQLASTLKNLTQMSASDGTVLIRFRGFPSEAGTPEKLDYEIHYGHQHLTTSILPGLIKRQGARFAYLSDQLLQAFSAFSEYGISNLYLRLPGADGKDLQNLRTGLHILSQFKQAHDRKTSIDLSKAGDASPRDVVFDPKGRPDANLTLLGAINGLTSAKILEVVKKIDDLMRRSDDSKPVFQYDDRYNTIFQIKSLREKLTRPPIELNNVKWLMVSREDQAISEKKAKLAQWVVNTSQGSPQKVAKVLTSVYGDDFNRINSKNLSERLHLSSALLNSIEKESAEKHLKEEVLGNIQSRLQTVKDEIFDDLYLSAQTDRSPSESNSGVLKIFHNQLFKMISFFKLRSTTRKKMSAMVHQAMQFSAQEYETLAKDFRITLPEAQKLVESLKACFGQGGEFNKRVFQQTIPFFIQYEKKIFEFLWYHLKDTILAKDRIAFLNSLQSLASQMNQPKRAFKILVEDFYHDPALVNFSDSKALMLANLILRRYDKSLADFEITPKDIIIDKANLDEEVVRYASWRIDKEQEHFCEKIRTIHLHLLEALLRGQTQRHNFSPNDLLGLEGECFIFLALIGGSTARTVLRSAVRDYGSPEAALYLSKHSADNLLHVIQNFRLVVRGLGVIGAMEDMATLDEVLQKRDAFLQNPKTKKYFQQENLLQEWINEAKNNIQFHR
jgi:hypothetical protein